MHFYTIHQDNSTINIVLLIVINVIIIIIIIIIITRCGAYIFACRMSGREEPDNEVERLAAHGNTLNTIFDPVVKVVARSSRGLR